VVLRLKFHVQDIAGIHLHIDIPKLLKTLHLDKLNSYAGIYLTLNNSVQYLQLYNELILVQEKYEFLFMPFLPIIGWRKRLLSWYLTAHFLNVM